MTSINRRTFLVRTAAGIGAASLACCGLSTLALQAPVKTDYSDTLSSKGTAMNQNILVAYASKAGSTMEVAQAVAEELTGRGYNVDIRPIKQVTSLNGYSGVVLGSAVRYGGWLSEAVKFVEANRAALGQVPTAFFAVHILNTGEDETSRNARLAYLDPVRKLVTPKWEAFFAGVGDMSKVSFIEGLIGKMVKSPEGDFRNWEAIRAWSQSILN